MTMTQNHTARLAHALNFTENGKAPEWVMLIPAGNRIEGRDGRWFSNPNPELIVERFETDGSEVVFDYEHATELEPMEGHPAAGWVKKIENRDGAIWGKVDWTQRALQMIEGKEYRFISPAIYFDPTSFEIYAVSSAALTHKPNFDMPALNKRGDHSQNNNSQINHPQNNPMETTMDKQSRIALCSKLGLAAEASDTSILDAVSVLQENEQKALNSAQQPSLDKFVPRADHDQVISKLEKAQNTINEANDRDITALVDDAISGKKIAPTSRDYHLAACRQDPEAFKKYIETAPVLDIALNSGLDDKQIPGGGELTAEDKALCSELGISEDEYKATGKAS